MRILSVGLDIPNKTTGSPKRIYHLGESLMAAGHQVHRLVAVRSADSAKLKDVENLGVICYPVILPEQPQTLPASDFQHLLRKIISAVEFRCQLLAAIFDPMPKAARSHWVMPLQTALAALLQQEIFDLVIVEHENNALLAKVVKPSIPIVMDAHNVLSSMVTRDYRLRKRQYGFTLFSLSERVQPKKLERLERDVLNRYDAVVVMSRLESDHLRALVPAKQAQKITVIENGVDVNCYRPRSSSLECDQVVFTGLMSWGPNVDGIQWFLQEIWPRVLQKRPAAQLKIVGADPAMEVYTAAMQFPHSVDVTGRVDEVIPFINDADVVVAPLRLGGGTRLKILEAAAMQRPIVATTVAAEGLEGLRDGEQLLLRDTPPAFADAVVQLLEDKNCSRRLAAAAREVAEEQYDWPLLGDKFEKLLSRIAGSATTPLLPR